MRKFQRIIIGAVLAGAMILAPSNIAKAAGTVSVAGDKETAAVGDNYQVTVTVSGAEGAATAPDVSVNYDVNRLNFVDCSGSYGGGAGGYITLNDSETTINFTILSGGQADVDVTGIFEGEEANPQVVTASVFVEGEDTAAVDDRARDDMGMGIEAGAIATSDGNLVSSVFADEFMPVGFFKTTVSYEEQMVEAAQFDMGNIVLLYVTDATGNNGNFKIYDQTTGELSDFLQLTGIENKFIIALKAGEEVSVPDGFAKATLQWNDQVLEAYSYIGDMPADSTVPASEFFMIYAVSSEGNTGWYIYDQKDGTYQRFNSGLYGGKSSGADDGILSQLAGATKSEDSEKSGINWMLIIVIGLGVFVLGLIITVIIMAVKIHEFNSYDYIDEDEELDNSSYVQRLAAQNENYSGDLGRSEAEMPKSKNIYEQYREEDEAAERAEEGAKAEREGVSAKAGREVVGVKTERELANSAVDGLDISDISESEAEVGRKTSARAELERANRQAEMYERDVEEESDIDDDEDIFSPRDRKLTREEKKLMKQEEKARKKQEKKMKKEFGEFGPVDWQSWQDAVEGGEKTAPARRQEAVAGVEAGAMGVAAGTMRGAGVDAGAMRGAGVDAGAVRRQKREMLEEEYEAPVKRRGRRVEEPDEDEFVIRSKKAKMSRREMQEELEAREREQMARAREAEARRAAENAIYEEQIAPKDNPMDMIRNIPANDNKAPVQAKPVQQFDFDDDFEFEFLSLDDED